MQTQFDNVLKGLEALNCTQAENPEFEGIEVPPWLGELVKQYGKVKDIPGVLVGNIEWCVMSTHFRDLLSVVKEFVIQNYIKMYLLCVIEIQLQVHWRVHNKSGYQDNKWNTNAHFSRRSQF